MATRIITLDSVHDISKFDCGNQLLNNWLQQTARQHQKKSLSQTYVLIDDGNPTRVLGFYSMSPRGLIPSERLPDKIAKRLPLNIPALTIGRLAVDQYSKGNGYGEELLIDAMIRAKKVSLAVGGWGLFVDAKDKTAAAFYTKYGFIALPSDPLILFMPIASIPEDVD